MNRIDVIVPLYRGLDEVRRCLDSVVSSRQRHPFELILIDDASPEPAFSAFLQHFSREHEGVTLLENRYNLGFVATVNRGMSLREDRDVVLLNSDTEVANDWLDRLERCAHAAPDIGTVTPFSNNATICSFPGFCESNPLPERWPLAELDALFSRVNAGAAVEIPTGVGFCMYITRACLDDVGLFDVERFGRGYGEENDFCRRAVGRGWRNLLCCDTFVYHEGGVSFSDEQDERVAKAQETLDRLYPDYHHMVQEHIATDPARVYRLNARLGMLQGSPRKRVLFVTHHLGGGTAKHIRELADYLSGEMDALLIKPLQEGVVSLSFDLSVDRSDLAFSLPGQYGDLLGLLRQLRISRVHFHHTLGVETSVWGLPADLEAPFDITLHDYYFINANPTQTDARGRYCQRLEQQAGSYELPVGVAEWQKNQRLLLEAADRVISPSAYTARLHERYFPGLRYLVAYHPDWERDAPYPAVEFPAFDSDAPIRILVIGAISLEKGADILEQTAVAAKAVNAPLEFHLLGYACRPLAREVKEYGPYDEQRIEALIREVNPHLAWFPALWPETYSYTLSETLRMGLPIVAPDIGAFPERLAHRPLTWVESWQHQADAWVDRFVGIREQLMESEENPVTGEWRDQPVLRQAGPFYRHTYLGNESPPAAGGEFDIDHLAELTSSSRVFSVGTETLSRKEQLLLDLVRLRQGHAGRILARMIPLRFQRALKRRLSRKPIHELTR